MHRQKKVSIRHVTELSQFVTRAHFICCMCTFSILLSAGNGVEELLPEIEANLTMIELQHVRMCGLAQERFFFVRRCAHDVLVC